MSEHPVFDPARFRERMISLGVAALERIRGCADDEVAQVLATRPEVGVPHAYVEFLRHFGRGGAGHLLRGTDVYYPDCLESNGYAEEFARDDDPGLATEGRFFFAVHQGYELYFFADGTQAVWSYVEGDGRAHRIARSLPAFLERAIDHPRAHWEALSAQDRANAEAKRRKR